MESRTNIYTWYQVAPSDPRDEEPLPAFIMIPEASTDGGWDCEIIHSPAEVRKRVSRQSAYNMRRVRQRSKLCYMTTASDNDDENAEPTEVPTEAPKDTIGEQPSDVLAEAPSRWADDEDDDDVQPYVRGSVAAMYGVESEEGGVDALATISEDEEDEPEVDLAAGEDAEVSDSDESTPQSSDTSSTHAGSSDAESATSVDTSAAPAASSDTNWTKDDETSTSDQIQVSFVDLQIRPSPQHEHIYDPMEALRQSRARLNALLSERSCCPIEAPRYSRASRDNAAAARAHKLELQRAGRLPIEMPLRQPATVLLDLGLSSICIYEANAAGKSDDSAVALIEQSPPSEESPQWDPYEGIPSQEDRAAANAHTQALINSATDHLYDRIERLEREQDTLESAYTYVDRERRHMEDQLNIMSEHLEEASRVANEQASGLHEQNQHIDELEEQARTLQRQVDALGHERDEAVAAATRLKAERDASRQRARMAEVDNELLSRRLEQLEAMLLERDEKRME